MISTIKRRMVLTNLTFLVIHKTPTKKLTFAIIKNLLFTDYLDS